jgi:hypothetical protein
LPKPFGSIEGRHGIDRPGYEPPVDEPVTLDDDRGPVGPIEIIGSFLVPIAGFVFAVMRFADDEVGPGLACLLVGALGFACWTLAIIVAL